MEPIPILHLINDLDDANRRSAMHVRMEHLGRERFNWHVGALRGGDGQSQQAFRELGARVIDLSSRGPGRKHVVKNVRQYVRENRIRIVHSHSARTILVAAGALIGLRDTVHLATKHNWYLPSDRPRGWMYTLLDRFSIYLCDHVIAVSQKMHQQITKLPLISTGRVTTIQNAIDCQSFYLPEERMACRQEFGIAPDVPLIGYAGRLVRLKKIDLLLRAFHQVLKTHPRAQLIIVGEDDPVEGRQQAYLKSLAEDLDIAPSVVWTGFRQDVPRLLAAMDIYVQASTNEGLSKSVLEAMAAGKAVITTDVGGAGEVVAQGETGLLIPPRSASAIASALTDLLDQPERTKTLSDAARRRIFYEFNLHQMITAYRQLYERLDRAPIQNGHAKRHRPTVNPNCSDDALRGVTR